MVRASRINKEEKSVEKPKAAPKKKAAPAKKKKTEAAKAE